MDPIFVQSSIELNVKNNGLDSITYKSASLKMMKIAQAIISSNEIEIVDFPVSTWYYNMIISSLQFNLLSWKIDKKNV